MVERDLGSLFAQYVPPSTATRGRQGGILLLCAIVLIWILTNAPIDHTIFVPILGVITIAVSLLAIKTLFSCFRNDPTVIFYENGIRIRNQLMRWPELTRIEFFPAKVHSAHAVTRIEDCRWKFHTRDGAPVLLEVIDGEYIPSEQLNLLLRRWCHSVSVEMIIDGHSYPTL